MRVFFFSQHCVMRSSSTCINAVSVSCASHFRKKKKKNKQFCKCSRPQCSAAQILRSHLETCGKDMPRPFSPSLLKWSLCICGYFFPYLVNAACAADHTQSEPYLHSQRKPQGMSGIFKIMHMDRGVAARCHSSRSTELIPGI